MEIRDNLTSETGWEIIEDSFSEKQLVVNGSNFMTGNGYLGYRGTFPEWRSDRYVACVVTDTWDMADGKWKELCTVPNGLYLSITEESTETTVELPSEHASTYSRSLCTSESWDFPSRGQPSRSKIVASRATKTCTSYRLKW